MMAYNCAHHWSAENSQSLILRLHWFHDKDHLHHPEDPETIVDRAEYILGLYLKADVHVEHVFNSNVSELKNTETRTDWLNPRSSRWTNEWSFDPSVILSKKEDKVVIWRPLFNAEPPRLWKRRVPNEKWDGLISHLKLLGYDVIELSYRTPIREATYHINTCNFVICYDGMWHYIAKNFRTPMFVSSNDSITRYHTRHAVELGQNQFYNRLYKLHEKRMIKGKNISPYDFAHRRAEKHKKIFWDWYNGNRQSGN